MLGHYHAYLRREFDLGRASAVDFLGYRRRLQDIFSAPFYIRSYNSLITRYIL